jgi:putative MATE family efflux protein
VTGSILRHILVMTGTSAIGLMAIFLGDLVNIFFLGLLGDLEVLAAIGYASSLLFLTTSAGIGLSIAATAVVAPAIGAGDEHRARRLSASAHIFAGLAALAICLAIWPFLGRLLALLGANARAHGLALGYLRILIPSLPMLALGMCSGAVLRSKGDARRSMNITLVGAIVNIILDPLLIFGLKLGIDGAALASSIARAAVMMVGFHGVIRVHRLMRSPAVKAFRLDAARISRIAVPAVLANIAMPISNAYVTAVMARFGDGAVAGWAVIGRIIPVAFGAIFALSGAIGPIIGQNHGARDYARVRLSMDEALKVTFLFTAAAWTVLFIAAPILARIFNITGEAADLVILFCRWVSPLFLFLGALFVSNAICNTLGWPHVATALNWGRATIGTFPFVLLGAAWAGAPGVLIGNMLGGVVFGIAGVLVAYRVINRLARQRERARGTEPASITFAANQRLP